MYLVAAEGRAGVLPRYPWVNLLWVQRESFCHSSSNSQRGPAVTVAGQAANELAHFEHQ